MTETVQQHHRMEFISSGLQPTDSNTGDNEGPTQVFCIIPVDFILSWLNKFIVIVSSILKLKDNFWNVVF